jgi:hypothetical protein
MLADHPHLQAELIARAYEAGYRAAFEAAVAEIGILHRDIRSGIVDLWREDDAH